MKILHVITMLELGGAQQNTLYSCRRLAERGHDVVLASGVGGLLDAEAAQGPYRHVPIPDLVRPVSAWRDAKALVSLTRLCRRERPDVVHTHSSKAGILGRLAARLAGVPVVVHTAHGWSFSDHHPALERVVYQRVEQLASIGTDWVVSVSREDLDKGLRLGIVPPDRGSVIRSGIDISRFSTIAPEALEVRRSWGFGAADTVIVNVSCLKNQKAPLDFVAAAARALRDAPSLGFVLVGDGELRSKVAGAVAETGLSHRFVLAGWRQDMPAVIQAADVLALTSLWEGLPRSVVQARAAGVPVVATAVNGTPEVIVDGVHGFLLHPHDIEGFAERFVRLARDPELRRRMGAKGRVDLEEFDQERMVDEQEILLEKLVARAMPTAART